MIKNIPDAVIDMPKGMEFSNQKPKIEVIVKKAGKVIYHNKAYACVMNMVQSVTTFTEEKGDIVLEGDTQIFGCGNAVIQMFATSELERKLKKAGVIDRAMLELQHMIKDPVLFEKHAKLIRKAVEGL